MMTNDFEWDLTKGPRPALIVLRGGPNDGWVYNRLAMAAEPPDILPPGVTTRTYYATNEVDGQGRQVYEYRYTPRA